MAGVNVTTYFNYLVRRQFIQAYTRTDGVLSLELNIPAIWQEIMMPHEAQVIPRGVHSTTRRELPNRIPTTIRSRIVKLGFAPAFQYHGVRQDDARRYILRHHDFNITIHLYRVHILPNIRDSINRQRIPHNQQFGSAYIQAVTVLRDEEINNALADPNNLPNDHRVLPNMSLHAWMNQL